MHRAQVREYRSGDRAALLDAWGRSFPRDPVTALQWREKVLLDANFEPELLRVAEHDGQVLGAAHGVRRLVTDATGPAHPSAGSGKGWVPFFFTVPRARGAGLGRRLLSEVLHGLEQRGCHQVDFASYTPHYWLPGLDRDASPHAAALLASCGFGAYGHAVAMERDLTGFTVPAGVRRREEELTASGYRFAELDDGTDDSLVDLLRLAADEFSPDWAGTVRRCVRGGMPLGQILLVRDPSGGPAGWAMHGAYDGDVERFGPFGVSARHRGTGLGAVLLHRTLCRMRERGAGRAWFLWGDETSAAGRLYLRTGFRTVRSFTLLRRPAAVPSAAGPPGVPRADGAERAG
ncbi:GNAT family N-acetyltransferase [Streptomyces sp. NPDC004111]|uniref:GNAT family N-acetyltransferase n=1 Tax=Streptomyces sp. NPDC004111 TaxID=3364690 RepID=UPI0036BDFD24